MLKSCPYCGKIHDKKYNCPKKPVRQRQDNRQSKFRSTYKWTKKAQAVKRRDGYLCQVCLRGLYHPERQYETEGLEVHHIQTVASCYEKRLDGYNLLTLCKRHHKMADAGKIPAKELQMIAAEQEEKVQDNKIRHPAHEGEKFVVHVENTVHNKTPICDKILTPWAVLLSHAFSY